MVPAGRSCQATTSRHYKKAIAEDSIGAKENTVLREMEE